MIPVECLQANALNYWPEEISNKEKEGSVLPRLIETQECFISLLHVSDKNPNAWIKSLKNTTLPPNIFLKHLVVLSDIGGEQLSRLKNTLRNSQLEEFLFTWKAKQYSYKFKSLSKACPWTNKILNIDGKSLIKVKCLTDTMVDVATVLLYAGNSLDYEFPQEIMEKAIIGNMIGDKKALDLFVRQRYLWVSRITGGATANSLGNLAQDYVKNFLISHLPTWDFSLKNLPVSENSPASHTSFDIVAKSPHNKYCAIEVSFQVTTNSTIERKSGQAFARLTWVHKSGHYIAYVIDGAGNFQRYSALQTICNNSDCTVNFSKISMQKLVEFLRGLEK